MPAPEPTGYCSVEEIKKIFEAGQAVIKIGPDIDGEDNITEDGVKQYIWEHARVPFGKIESTGMLTPPELGGSSFADFLWPKWIDRSSPESLIPATLSPDDIHVVVCGGRGSWCTVCHGWGYGGLAVTREIRTP